MTWALSIPIDSSITLEVIIGLGGFIWYILNRRARDRRLKVRLANMLHTELVEILIRLQPAPERDAAKNVMLPLPYQTYDGLISSTNISYFDKRIQRLLYMIYLGVKNTNMGDPTPIYLRQKLTDGKVSVKESEWLSGLVDSAIVKVEKFRDHHQYSGHGLTILKAIHWAYDD